MNDFVHRDGFPALRLSKAEQSDGNTDEKSPPRIWNIRDQEPIPRHDFWGCRDAIQVRELEKIRQDCRTVFSARAKESQEAYSAGITYFCPCLMPPRCALEALALDIFRMHTQHIPEGVIIPEQSGAEWWTLVLDHDEDKDSKKQTDDNSSHDNDGDDEDEDESDEVGLHFDADYGLEDQASGLLLHPRLATVTYLSDYGAPTVVFQKRSPPPDDREKTSLQGDIAKAWVSHPAIGKHIAFDGRFLHGARFFPSSTLPTPGGKDETSFKEPALKKAKLDRVRYTFLVNVWINHCPLDAEPLDDEICQQLLPVRPIDKPFFVWKDAMSLDQPMEFSCAKLTKHGDDGEAAGEEEFVVCDRLVTIKYESTLDDLHDVVASGETVELSIEPGAVHLMVGEELPSSDESGDGDDD